LFTTITNQQDTGLEIAKALNYNYIFNCEFEEIYDPLREKHVQGGGVHGNGILSRYSFLPIHHPTSSDTISLELGLLTTITNLTTGNAMVT
jgi:hypothetical protein